ncbi:MAG: hypothetical protein HFH93_05550 [Lachnospiraceae bacterium]|nr:hypothetical protein [Lachnospiraceae bacterium]
MKKRKLLSSILGITLMAALLAGCGKGDDSEKNSASGNESSQVQSEENVSGSEAEVPTYKIAVVRTDGDRDFVDNNAFLDELEEKHGIHIEWEIYAMADWEEQRSLILASKELPDAFLGHYCGLENEVINNRGLFLELTDLIPENMPNLTKIFEEDPQMLALAKDRDGKIYGLVSKEPFVPIQEGALYLNPEWLQNVGKEVPTTYLELQDVLKAFIEQDADGDGDPDNETGVVGCGYPTLNFYFDTRRILVPFGLQINPSNYMGLNSEGEPVFIPAEEKFKEAVVWMHTLYAEGILDPEYFTADASMNAAKTVGCEFGWDMPEGFIMPEALAGPDGNRYIDHNLSTSMHTGEFYISNKCENPEKLLQWADEFYTDVATLQNYFGPVPECIADNGDGTYQVLLPADGGDLSTSAWAHSFKGNSMAYMSKEFETNNVILPEGEEVAAKLARDSVNGKYARDAFPVVKYTTEEAEALAGIQQDLIGYAETQYAHWVVDGGVEEEWDAYLEQLNKMQLETYIELQMQAYNAYMENMNES